MWARDRGGRISQTYQYVFSAQSTAADEVPGDLTGDGLPDVATADQLGNLRVHPGTGTGGLGAPYVGGTAAESPFSDGWRDVLLAHHGAGNNQQDELWALERPGSGHGAALVVYRNDVGDVQRSRSLVVGRPACAGCAGYRSDWSGVTQMVLVGSGRSRALVVVDDGLMWRFQVILTGVLYGRPVAVPLPGVDLSHADLVSPGDLTGDGLPDLWVRDRVTGRLTQFAGTARGFEPQGTIVAWSGFDASTHPVVTSVGDLSGDGVLDLLTTSPLGGLQIRSTTSLRSPSWISPQPFVAKAHSVEGQLTRP